MASFYLFLFSSCSHFFVFPKTLLRVILFGGNHSRVFLLLLLFFFLWNENEVIRPLLDLWAKKAVVSYQISYSLNIPSFKIERFCLAALFFFSLAFQIFCWTKRVEYGLYINSLVSELVVALLWRIAKLIAIVSNNKSQATLSKFYIGILLLLWVKSIFLVLIVNLSSNSFSLANIFSSANLNAVKIPPRICELFFLFSCAHGGRTRRWLDQRALKSLWIKWEPSPSRGRPKNIVVAAKLHRAAVTTVASFSYSEYNAFLSMKIGCRGFKDYRVSLSIF